MLGDQLPELCGPHTHDARPSSLLLWGSLVLKLGCPLEPWETFEEMLMLTMLSEV